MNDIVSLQEQNKAALAAQSPSGALTPPDMLRMMVEKGTTDNVEVLERMMAMQERWEENEAKKAYVMAKSAFMAECPVIEKDKHVQYETRSGQVTDYKHASLSGAIEQIKPLLAKHGLSHSWVTKQSEGAVQVTCCVTHIMGHQECTSLSGGADNSGGKNSIQAIGSTVSYLQRYTLFSILGLSSDTLDDDGQGGAGTSGKSTQNEPNLPEVKMYSQESFNANIDKWADAIRSKKISPDDLIARAESVGQLTDEMKLEIREVGEE